MMLRRLVLILGTMSCLAFPLIGCNAGDTGGNSQGTSGGDTAGSSAAGTGAVGEIAPGFALSRLDGSTLKLSDMRGKAVLLDFWATWCPPCRMALPHLQELSEQYAADLVVVGVALDRGREKIVAPFVAKEKLTFEIVLPDEELKITQNFGGVSSIPTTFLIDGEGRITNKWIGFKTKEEYESAIKDVLGVK